MGNYDDPRVEDLKVLCAFKYADIPGSDSDAEQRGEYVERVDDLADDLGGYAEVYTTKSLADEVRWAIRGVLSPGSGTAWPLPADYERIVAAVVREAPRPVTLAGDHLTWAGRPPRTTARAGAPGSCDASRAAAAPSPSPGASLRIGLLRSTDRPVGGGLRCEYPHLQPLGGTR